MKRLHLSILLLIGWFFAFYNVERIFSQVNLASFVYLLAPLLGMLVLTVSQLRQVPLALYVPVSLVCVVVLRSLLGYESASLAFSLAITETLATWVTIALSYQLGKSIDEFSSAAATAIVGHLEKSTLPFEEAQAIVVRELRRARLFDRPIAVLALNPQPNNEEESLDRFTHEFSADLLRQYTSLRAATCLSEQLRSCDILTQTNGQFLALMPELDRTEALSVAEQMSQELGRLLDMDLKVGVSMFPEDEVTALGLIERAEAEIESLRAAGSAASKLTDLGSSVWGSRNGEHALGFPQEGKPESCLP